MKTDKSVSTSELKTHCSEVIDDVVRRRRPVVITKRGRPVAKIVPLEAEATTLLGFAKGTVRILGDVVEPLDVSWEAAE